MNASEELKQQVAEINDLLTTLNVLTWDARIHMPPGGASTRGKQMATLSKLARERLLSWELRAALERAEQKLDDHDAVLERRAVEHVRAAVEMFDRIPANLVQALAEHKSDAQQAWEAAREANDFMYFAPALAQMVALNKQLADAIGYETNPYDALLTLYEPGMTSVQLQSLFKALRTGILPLLDAIRMEGEEPEWAFLTRDYPVKKQREATLFFAKLLGYDLSRGRLDTSIHPFEISFTRQDVRITTRYRRNYLPMSLFGTIHETGHALYEQGTAPELTRTALTTDFVGLYAVAGTSYGTHESQSRLWENQVGRSYDFWQVNFPALKEMFPEQLGDVTADMFYRAVNRVTPSLIRVEADELTYNLHIMLRVELEMKLMEGALEVRDIPQVWQEQVQVYLGLEVPSDNEGALQDIHWSAGLIGSFPTYTIGNVMAAQWFDAAKQQDASVLPALTAGDYAPLRHWLEHNIYRFGRAYTGNELLERSTGQTLRPEPYLRYLNEKYRSLYEFSP